MDDNELGCRCGDPRQPRCGHHARQALRLTQNRMALAIHGCDECRPSQSVSELVVLLDRYRREWFESVEGRLICRGALTTLPPGSFRDEIEQALQQADARVAARRALA